MPYKLRADAESAIRSGTVPPATAPAVGQDALELLYRLASAGDNASDALCLLHELKVHQVELDLQLAQAQENEQELAEELAVYRELYESAPAAYFSVSLDGHIIRANRAGAEFFGVDAAGLSGRRIDDAVALEFRPNLHAMLDELRNSGGTTGAEVRSNGQNGSSRALRIVATPAPDSGSYLIIILDAGATDLPAVSR